MKTWIHVSLVTAVLACGPEDLRAAKERLDSDGEDTPTLRTAQAVAPGCAVQFPGAVHDVRAYGALGNSVTDDRAAIQRAVNAAIQAGGGTVLFPGNPDGSKRVYKLGVVQQVSGDPAAIYIYGGASGITPVNLRLVLSPGVRLKAIPNSYQAYGLIYVRRASNVSIEGGYLVGDKFSNSYPGGAAHDKGHGIAIDRSLNVKVDGVRVVKFPGDGIYVNTHPEETTSNPPGADGIEICRSVIDDNSRTGVGVITVDGLVVRDSLISRTAFDPRVRGEWQAGVDIEPNPPYAGGLLQYAQDIAFRNTDIQNNAGPGVMMFTAAGPVRNVRFLDGVVENNATGYWSPAGYWVVPKNIEIGAYGAPHAVTDFKINRDALRRASQSSGFMVVQAGSSGTIRCNDLTYAGPNPLHIYSSAVQVCGNAGYPDPDCTSACQ